MVGALVHNISDTILDAALRYPVYLDQFTFLIEDVYSLEAWGSSSSQIIPDPNAS